MKPQGFWSKGHIAPIWLPNWQYEDEYPDLENTRQQDFAWEFLRRHPEYQNDYNRIAELYEISGLQGSYKTTLGFNIFQRIDDPILPENAKRFHSELYITLSKWGLYYYLLNPAYDFRETASLDVLGRAGVFNHSMQTYSHALEGGLLFTEGIQTPSDGGIIPTNTEGAYLFDFTLPMQPQLAKAKKWAVAQQEALLGKRLGASKSKLKNFPLYLRILDADAAGVENSVIGEALFGDIPTYDYSKNANHYSKRATALKNNRESAYYLLSSGYKAML